MLVLLQSIMSGQRRVWWRLLLSCIVGGGASALAGHIFQDSTWVYVYCGVAAIMAENVLFGLVKASEEFKEKPIDVFAQLWRIVVPAFGKATDKAGLDLPQSPDVNQNDQYGGGHRPRKRRDDDSPVG